MAEPYPGVISFIRRAFSQQNLTPETIDIMIASLSESSLKQYNSAYKKWWLFCNTNKIADCFSVSIPFILKFFTTLFDAGAGYSTLNTYRSALSLVLGKNVGSHDYIIRFLKGVFKKKPCFPKYQCTWDTNLVLDFISNWYPNEDLPLDQLTKKLVTLLALSTAQRVQTLSIINICNIAFNESNVIIIIDNLIKTSAPGKQMPRLSIPFFPNRPEICPAKTLVSYINSTKLLRDGQNSDKLILTTKRPFHNATASTISRWIKLVLSESGINTSIFTAHSARHASTSAANRRGVSVDIIKQTAGWSGNSLIFGKFYNRPLEQNNDNVFAQAIFEDC
ncbi:uncharacterized protein LOC113226989 [Hyposmocoma kahamanoa]|uniref:uncharacterized protein LOC113226989 n=1 Tax=Hyposmocoma kahamanoa TaxID=1477025 RepID=UPI000E6D7953|nr:uncharacterized protein LOC113226989 [Hyposmocoma kahamanoa]XP_026315627.1 uncharacterized protein LOC113226989 [Hyposmocoma kahamanoa]